MHWLLVPMSQFVIQVPLIVAVVNSNVKLQPIKAGSRQFDVAPTGVRWIVW